MGLFLLQNVYADIKIIDGDTIIFNEKKFDFQVLMPQKLINTALIKKNQIQLWFKFYKGINSIYKKKP